MTWSFGGGQEGIARSVTELVRDQSDWADVSVATLRAAQPMDGARLLPVTLNGLERRLPFALGYAAASRRILRHAGPFDIVHAHVPTLARSDVATVHLFPPRHLIALVRETLARTRQPIPREIRRSSRNAALTRWTYARNMTGSTRLIAVSDRLAQALAEEYAIDPGRIAVLPLGVGTPPADLRPAQRPENASRVALFVGHQYMTKGLGFVIDALAELGPRAPTVVVIGEGSEGSRGAMESYARDRGVCDRIRFEGYQADVWPWFAMADALVYPTFFDTFGLVIGEALAAGCPVITTRAAGIVDLLPAGPALTVLDRPDDVSGIASALASLPAHGALTESARAAAASLGWRAHREGVRAEYAGILERRGGTPRGMNR